MGFGILMQDNTPVDAPFRRSGRAAEESIRLGYVPGGPYYPRSMPRRRALGFVPGGPYYPRSMPVQRTLDYVPGALARCGPYYPRGNPIGYGIPPGQAARVPQYNGAGASWLPGVPETFGRFSSRTFGGIDSDGVPGVPETFGDDVPSSGTYDTSVGPVYDPSQLNTQSNSGTTWNWNAAANATGQVASAIVNAFTQGGQATCPTGYTYIGNGRCAPVSAPGSSTGMLVALGVLGIGAAVLLTRRRGG